ncbi:MerR family transcriptional regulator [Priestia endophytica]|jgi:DNA-binding transcriptional MerR regulator|uniref:MerR family DNA-binding transcriptional regulator n=2 Tax=Priestia endophytica TaxID=135735 RepID=A0A329EU20_9BACI|nr:MerR family transcriptional regulator [Priestia endophytica]KYG27397.1 MerR family transcriptional regulator [Priestia endophytica]MBG9814455.1 MerR family transcriptional regulator [Priestia endophytica]MCM3539002.1 MerR family transcriptional regulator [Priestia endophytica]MED4069962.1 MerR family transcriptional regulator [Priestia endophytica]RAS80024.1 MerR family DNA-binding transcriptional regulator [Priestia endophytica]
MKTEEASYRDKKVMSIGIVKELTGLSERQIRYYEKRQLLFPERTSTGIRKYSFSDVERLMDIADKIEEGVQTKEIRHELARREEKNRNKTNEIRNRMLQGQLNAHFHSRNY